LSDFFLSDSLLGVLEDKELVASSSGLASGKSPKASSALHDVELGFRSSMKSKSCKLGSVKLLRVEDAEAERLNDWSISANRLEEWVRIELQNSNQCSYTCQLHIFHHLNHQSPSLNMKNPPRNVLHTSFT
jgi:hypothetical protein